MAQFTWRALMSSMPRPWAPEASLFRQLHRATRTSNIGKRGAARVAFRLHVIGCVSTREDSAEWSISVMMLGCFSSRTA